MLLRIDIILSLNVVTLQCEYAEPYSLTTNGTVCESNAELTTAL